MEDNTRTESWTEGLTQTGLSRAAVRPSVVILVNGPVYFSVLLLIMYRTSIVFKLFNQSVTVT